MIRRVTLAEEIMIKAKNKVGLLADIALVLSQHGVNIESALGYEVGKTAVLTMVTNANLTMVGELRKKGYTSVKETEVLMVELDNKPGALKVVTTEMKKARIDIERLYVTSSSLGPSSRMVLKTSNNEAAMALLSRYIQ